jgi:hypothetical protein
MINIKKRGEMMKKMIMLTLASAISVLLFTGCSEKGSSAAPTSVAPEHTRSGGFETPIVGHINKKTIHEAIMKAGEENGWTMTAFKSTSIIAEKIDGDKSATATISFAEDTINIVKESSTLGAKYDTYVKELQDSIYKKLQESNTH